MARVALLVQLLATGCAAAPASTQARQLKATLYDKDGNRVHMFVSNRGQRDGFRRGIDTFISRRSR